MRDDYDFKDGLFSGYDPKARKYDRSTWMYELGQDGYVKVDPTFKHQRCVLNLLKQHYSRYTPEVVSGITGTPQEHFLKICEMIAETAAPDKTLTMLYALGWTQHSQGTQMIRCAAMVQLLLGNVGMAGGGMNALRGHSNIQGLTDLGLLTNLLPGYLTLPSEHEADYKSYIATRTPKPLRPNQLNYWSNYPKFHVSLMKAWFGPAATKDNNWCYDWLPKLDKPHDVLQVFEDMYQGRVNGYVCQGFNAVAAFPNKQKLVDALSKLKFLVVIDPLATETSEFWRNFGEHNDVDSSKIQTEVFRLPSTCFAEEDGSLVNSGRWLQWHWKGAEPPGEAKEDTEIMGTLFMRLRELYKKEGGAFPDPILGLTWNHLIADAPSPEELAKEFSGKALADVMDREDRRAVLVKAGDQLDGFAQLAGRRLDGLRMLDLQRCLDQQRQHDGPPRQLGSERPRQHAGLGVRVAGQSSHSVQPRVRGPDRQTVGSEEQADRLERARSGPAWTCRTSRPTRRPTDGMHPFIMNPEGVARLFAVDQLVEGPFPEHYEPVESPLPNNPDASEQSAGAAQPGVPDLQGRPRKPMGEAKDFPYVGTTYRLTEHFHYWTKHARINAILQPEQFVEIGEDLARDKGIKHGDKIKVQLEARRDHGRRGRDQAPADAGRGGQEDLHGRHSDPLGLQGSGQARLSHQHADAVRGRREHQHARVQDVPGERREGLDRETRMALQSLDIQRRSATTTPSPSAARDPARSPS